MSDGHFRSLQPRNGQRLLQKSASKKVLILEKSRVKIPLVIGGPLKVHWRIFLFGYIFRN